MATSSVTLTSTTTGDVPVMGANVFAKGEFAADANLVTNDPGLSVVVKRRWNDGSPKHAIFAGRATLTANTPRAITFNAGTPATGTPLAHADIVAAAPTATVTLTGITQKIGTAAPVALPNISVALADAIAAGPQRTWLATPQMVECHYLVKPRADIYVWFHVRRFAGGHTWVRTIVEYSKLPYTDDTFLNYTAVATIGATTVWNNAGAAFNHALETRWSVEGWFAGGATVTASHNPAQLRATKLVPNFFERNSTIDALLPSLRTSYTPGSLVDLRLDYGETGYDPQIGLLPLWDMLYVATGDVRAWRAVQANAFAVGAHATVWRDPANARPARLATYANWSYEGQNQGGYTSLPARNQLGDATSYSSVNRWDTAHNVSSGYLAYLITGDYAHLETLQLQCTGIFLSISTADGAGTNRTVLTQTRGIGWFFRTVAQFLALAPDTGEQVDRDFAADIGAWLESNIAYHTANGPAGAYANNSIGYPLTISTYDETKPLSTAPWMHHFWIQSMGHASDLEPLAAAKMPALVTLRDWMYKGIVGLLGPGTDGTFDYRYAGTYNITVSDVVRPNFSATYPNQLYQNWGQVWNATLAYISAGADAGGYPRPGTSASPTLYAGHFGYFNNLLPAIAYAAEHNAPGAVAAWNRLAAATNWSAFRLAVSDQPTWAVMPRSVTSSVNAIIPAAVAPSNAVITITVQ